MKAFNKKVFAYLLMALIVLTSIPMVGFADGTKWYALTTSVSSNSAGVVTKVLKSGNDRSSDNKYKENSVVTLTAVPNPGYKFVKWTKSNGDEITPNSISIDVRMDNDKERKAHFALDQVTLRLTVNAGGVATIGSTEYPVGTHDILVNRNVPVDIKAFSNAGYEVAGFKVGSVATFDNAKVKNYPAAGNQSITVGFNTHLPVYTKPYYDRDGYFSGYDINGVDIATGHDPRGDVLSASLTATPAISTHALGETVSVTLTPTVTDGDGIGTGILGQIDYFQNGVRTDRKNSSSDPTSLTYSYTIPSTVGGLVAPEYVSTDYADRTEYVKTINYDMVDRYANNDADNGPSNLMASASARIVVSVPKTFTVKFMNGINEVQSFTSILYNGKVTCPQPPTAPAGQMFDGWKIGGPGGVPFTNDSQVKGDIPNIKATWKDIPKNFWITADNIYSLYFNGELIKVITNQNESDGTYGWQTAEAYTLDLLESDNMIAISAQDFGVAAGVLAKLDAGSNSAVTNASDWVYYEGPTAPANDAAGKKWTEFGYDDSNWKKPSVIKYAWGTIKNFPGASDAQWIWSKATDLNKTVYFRLNTVDRYTVTFDADGGSLPDGTINPRTVKANAVTGSFPTPSKAGFGFDGWFLPGADSPVTSFTIEGDVTLTAHWTEMVTITFDDEPGVPSISAISFSKGGSLGEEVLLENQFKNTETSVFGGWYYKTSESPEPVMIDKDTKFNTSTVLYQRWTAIPVKKTTVRVSHIYTDGTATVTEKLTGSSGETYKAISKAGDKYTVVVTGTPEGTFGEVDSEVVFTYTSKPTTPDPTNPPVPTTPVPTTPLPTTPVPTTPVPTTPEPTTPAPTTPAPTTPEPTTPAPTDAPVIALIERSFDDEPLNNVEIEEAPAPAAIPETTEAPEVTAAPETSPVVDVVTEAVPQGPVKQLQKVVVLPKTGEIPASLFYGIGGLLGSIGVFMRRKK